IWPPMHYYPLLLNLTGKTCLVVGAGQVGLRKIRTLVECGAGLVRVVDTRPAGPDLTTLLDDPRLEFLCRPFEPQDLEDCTLVIASTDNEEVNWRISRLCAERKILCNIVDQPEKCSFILASLFTQGDLTIAISTAGKSPALAKKIRRDLKQTFGPEYGLLVELMGRLRPAVMGLGRSTAWNTEIFASIVSSPILESLKQGDAEAVRAILTGLLPEELHPQLEDLCHGLS
ncbi:MAG: bifunctional precorrin-2 dehydrogenase/sirohydrochlorin ferrochelatase, partial [Desulfovibrionales bacterium]